MLVQLVIVPQLYLWIYCINISGSYFSQQQCDFRYIMHRVSANKLYIHYGVSSWYR